MRLKMAAALAALPFTTTANAANVYSACVYDNETGASGVTQLFTLKGDALRDYYGEWTYEKNKVWEEQFAKEPYEVRGISGYYDYNFVGQFGKFVEKQGWSHPNCWVTTSRDHALGWFAKYGGKLETGRAQDWRPDAKAGVVGISDWSGRSSSVVEAEPEPEAEAASTRKTPDAASDGAPHRPKMTNAEADAKYEADMAEYNRKLAEQQKQVADFKRAEDEVVRKKQEQKLAAERAAADYQRQLEAHAQAVRTQQLEYQKEIAKPAGVANAVYRGFWGPDCDAARRSATLGAGTSVGTMFKEVMNEPAPGRGCTVQGWWWNTGKGTASRQ